MSNSLVWSTASASCTATLAIASRGTGICSGTTGPESTVDATSRNAGGTPGRAAHGVTFGFSGGVPPSRRARIQRPPPGLEHLSYKTSLLLQTHTYKGQNY